MVRRRRSRRAPHAIDMGTLGGFPNPPAMVRRRRSRRRTTRLTIGLVGGSPMELGFSVAPRPLSPLGLNLE